MSELQDAPPPSRVVVRSRLVTSTGLKMTSERLLETLVSTSSQQASLQQHTAVGGTTGAAVADPPSPEDEIMAQHTEESVACVADEGANPSRLRLLTAFNVSLRSSSCFLPGRSCANDPSPRFKLEV